MSNIPIKNHPEIAQLGWGQPFRKDPMLSFMQAPPRVDMGFISEVSDDFLRTGLHRMGEHLEPFNQGVQTTICPFKHKDMRNLHYEFLRHPPHELSFLTAKIEWNREKELLLLDRVVDHYDGWQCYLPECRSCTEALYLFLFPQMVYQQWINTLTAHIHMLTTETLRQLETMP